MPGPKPRSLLRDSDPDVFGEALRVIGRPDVDLDTLGTGSNLGVRWSCTTCSHEWDAKPSARFRGTGCPECARASRARSRAQAPPGKSLDDLYPLIAGEFQQNLARPDMGPRELRHAAQQRCLWRCGTCEHEWITTVATRTAGGGCPKCGNQRKAQSRRQPNSRTGTAAGAATFPLSELVGNLTNPDLDLQDLRPNSIDRCRWRCSDCSFEWVATITNRVGKRSGCPMCASVRNGEKRSRAPEGESLQARHPDIAAEFKVNVSRPDRTPEQIWPGSNMVCRWRCTRGHEWLTTVASRVSGAGCSRCAGRGQSRLEFEVAEILRVATGLEVILDAPVRAGGRNWRLDLALPGTPTLRATNGRSRHSLGACTSESVQCPSHQSAGEHVLCRTTISTL